MDWGSFDRAARTVAGSGRRLDGSQLLKLRSQLVDICEEAVVEVEREAKIAPLPRAELLLVDRHAWIGGNIRTLERLFGDLDLKGTEAKILSWEGGALIGMVARAVLGQYDPFRDQLLVVYPNLGEFSDAQGLRWLLFHEMTHVAQFRAAPWMGDRIIELSKRALDLQQRGWAREAMRRAAGRLPELVQWLRDAMQGKAQGTPLLDLLPDEQREAIMTANALVTVLEGHATYLTELIARRVLPEHEEINRRVAARRNRPPLLKLVEAIGGIEMKRQQYVLGRDFCEAVWERGGPEALAPAWRGPEWMPTLDELRSPDDWLRRVSVQTSA